MMTVIEEVSESASARRVRQLERTLALIADNSQLGSLVYNLAFQALAKPCPGCEGEHHERRWAMWLGVCRRTIRRKRKKAGFLSSSLTHQQISEIF